MRHRLVARTFTFLVFFNFHLENIVIYMFLGAAAGWRARRSAAHVCRSGCVGAALCAALALLSIVCARGWRCDTFILAEFFPRPLYWKLEMCASSRNAILSRPPHPPTISPPASIVSPRRNLRNSKRRLLKYKQVSFQFLWERLWNALAVDAAGGAGGVN